MDSEQSENSKITLTDEDGKEVEFEFIDSFDFEGHTYYALVPLDGEKDDEYVILRLEQENGEDILSTIDDDDEFDRVADFFEDEYLSEIDYDADAE